MDTNERVQRVVGGRHRNRWQRTERALIEIIEEQAEAIERLSRDRDDQPPERRFAVGVQMENNQRVTLRLGEQDQAGNTLPLDEGTITWGADRSDLVTLEPSADGSTCDAVRVLDAVPGDTQVSVSIQMPDPGDGSGLPAPIPVPAFVVTMAATGAPVAGVITADAPVPA